MRKQASLPGGDLEYAVLVALWTLGTATAREVHDQVGAPKGLVYTTIAKVLDRLCAKELVSRQRGSKAFVFSARVKRDLIDRARAKEAIGKLWSAEPRPAMATLVDAVALHDPDLLDELAEAVDARRKARRGP